MSVRLAIVETHPIQYKVPWFRRLSQEQGLDVDVLYAMVPNASQQGEGFGVSFNWDIPLLEGYDWERLDNISKHPSVTRFRGCDTPGLYRAIGSRRWDVILVNGWVTKTCLQALIAARRSGIPCVVRGEANDLRKRVWWKRLIQRLLVNQYAAALYIGKANEAFYRARGVPEEHLFFGPYCIDNERFAASAAATDRELLRREWAIPERAFCFLFCGKLQSKKRPMDVLQALSQLRTPGVSAAHLLIAGDGELRSTCESFARGHELPVSFAGFLNQSELPGAYAVADCLVLPSDNGETWGLVVNEAMACGVPAIVSDQVGCVQDLVTHGETGLVFRCGDVGALTGCMRRVMAAAESMENACRRRAGNYSYECLVEGTVQAVTHVTEK